MNRNYAGFWKGNIVSYNGKARTARITIPTLTDGIDDGITATFAYPVGHDDKDTEIQILAGADCYVFFEQLDPASPVIFAYSSHGTGAVVDVRRIRQASNVALPAQIRNPYCFAPPIAPHLAAAQAGVRLARWASTAGEKSVSRAR